VWDDVHLEDVVGTFPSSPNHLAVVDLDLRSMIELDLDDGEEVAAELEGELAFEGGTESLGRYVETDLFEELARGRLAGSLSSMHVAAG
jgi:hypothetical protein